MGPGETGRLEGGDALVRHVVRVLGVCVLVFFGLPWFLRLGGLADDGSAAWPQGGTTAVWFGR